MITDPKTLDPRRYERVKALLEAEPVIITDKPAATVVEVPPVPGSTAALAGPNSPATQASAAAAGGVAGALVIIMIWLINLAGASVPEQVVVALTVLVGAIVHWAVVRFALNPALKSLGLVAELRRRRARTEYDNPNQT